MKINMILLNFFCAAKAVFLTANATAEKFCPTLFLVQGQKWFHSRHIR